jgi:hypothetical protein
LLISWETFEFLPNVANSDKSAYSGCESEPLSSIERICPRDMIPWNGQLNRKDDDDEPNDENDVQEYSHSVYSSFGWLSPKITAGYPMERHINTDKMQDCIDGFTEVDIYGEDKTCATSAINQPIARKSKSDESEERRGKKEDFKESAESVVQVLYLAQSKPV